MEALFPGFQENMVKEEIEISHRVHSMIIGRRGMGIRKIMADYKVDIKFPRQGDANPDLVVVSCLLDLTKSSLLVPLAMYNTSRCCFVL